MLWNRNVVSALSSYSRQPQVASCLSSLLVPELAELAGKRSAAQVAGQLHTAMTSSRTKWSRMSLGTFAFLKMALGRIPYSRA